MWVEVVRGDFVSFLTWLIEEMLWIDELDFDVLLERMPLHAM